MAAQNGHSTRRLLVIGQLRPFSGNNSTSLRIAGYLEEEGFECVLRDVSSFKSSSDFLCTLHELEIDAAIGIHALRAGIFLKDCPLPYSLIFGGTDLNEYSRRAKDLITMTTASHHATMSDALSHDANLLIIHETVSNALSLVTFCQPMSDTVHLLWPEETKKLHEIPQAVMTHCVPKDEPEIWKILNIEPEAKCFILVAGLRPVKDPLYLIHVFTDWYLRMRSKGQSVHLLIIGPEIDAEYSEMFHQELKSAEGVHLLGGMSLADTHRIIRHSFCLVNTSKSEGMCMAILEAMDLETPVMARDIPSNRSLVSHLENGIIFESPQDFVLQAEELMRNENLRLKIIQKAKIKVGQHHNCLREKLSYLKIAQELVKRRETASKHNGSFVECSSSPSLPTKTCVNGSIR